jgi:hypothetical protein
MIAPIGEANQNAVRISVADFRDLAANVDTSRIANI